MMEGDMQVGGVQFPEHPPPHPATTSPLSQKKGTGAPLTLVLLSPPPPSPNAFPPPKKKIMKMQRSVLGLS